MTPEKMHALLTEAARLLRLPNAANLEVELLPALRRATGQSDIQPELRPDSRYHDQIQDY